MPRRLSPCTFVTAMLFAIPVAALEPVSANSPSTPTLQWHAPEGCPTDGDFRRRIEEYLGGSRSFARAPTSADALVVSARGGFHVTLRLEQAGQTRTRILDTASCVEALDAAALVVALAIDPSVVSRVPAVPTPSVSAVAPPLVDDQGLRAEPCSCTNAVERVAVAPCPPSVLPAPAPTQKQTTVAAIQSPPTLAPACRPRPEPLRDAKLSLEAFQLTEANLRRLPGLSLGLGLGAAISFSEWRVSLAAVTSDGIERSPSGGGEFRLLEGRLQACYLSTASLSVGPCASMSAGALTAKGFDVDVPERKTKFWFSAGVGALLRYAPGDFAEFGLAVNAEHPFTRSYFELTGSSLYRPSALGFYAGPMLGLRVQ